jgi:hypothetical protein
VAHRIGGLQSGELMCELTKGSSETIVALRKLVQSMKFTGERISYAW